MKTLIVLTMLLISTLSYSQNIMFDSLTTTVGDSTATFSNISPRFPNLSFGVSNISNADTLKFYNLNELGDTVMQSFRKFKTYGTIDTVIFGINEGSRTLLDYEIEFTNPNIRMLYVVGTGTMATTLKIFLRKRYLNF